LTGRLYGESGDPSLEVVLAMAELLRAGNSLDDVRSFYYPNMLYEEGMDPLKLGLLVAIVNFSERCLEGACYLAGVPYTYLD